MVGKRVGLDEIKVRKRKEEERGEEEKKKKNEKRIKG